MFGKHWRQAPSTRPSFFLSLFPDNEIIRNVHFQVGSDVRTVPEFKLHPICGMVVFTSLLCSSAIITNERLGQKQQK